MYKPHLPIICLLLLCVSPLLLTAQSEDIPETLQSNFTDKSRPNWLKLKANVTFSKEDFLALIDETQSGNEASLFTLKTTKEGNKGRTRYVYLSLIHI